MLLRNKKIRDKYPEYAKKLGLSTNTLQSLMTAYYDSVKRELNKREKEEVKIHGLLSFKVSITQVRKQLEKLRTYLKFSDQLNFRQTKEKNTLLENKEGLLRLEELVIQKYITRYEKRKENYGKDFQEQKGHLQEYIKYIIQKRENRRSFPEEVENMPEE